MSTVVPETSRFAAQCTKHDVAFIDAPVSGSVKPAQDGALVILVGTTQPAMKLPNLF
jgi:3-hydroxyisobutyrate dehydrogenase